MQELSLPSPSEFFHNPIVADGADPWVILKNGYYWFCYSDGDRSIYVARAESLAAIGSARPLLVWLAPPDSPYGCQTWAPELHELDGRWYIYFTATDPQSREAQHRMYVLESLSEHPSGPYQLKARLAAATDRWAIDGTVLDLGPGRRYFVWSGWDGEQNIQQNLYIAPMKNPWTLATDSANLRQYELPSQGGKAYAELEGGRELALGESLVFAIEVEKSGSYCLEIPYTQRHSLPASLIVSVDGRPACHVQLAPGVGAHWQSAQKKLQLSAGRHELRLEAALLGSAIRGIRLSPYGSDRILISRPTHVWERRGGPPYINEAPQLLRSRHRQNIHLIYSASGSWTDDYALGRLSLQGEDPLDAAAWQKHGPVFTKTDKVFGPGHACFTQSLDGREDWIVYHSARHSGAGWKRQIHAQPFAWNPADEPHFGQAEAPTERLPLPGRLHDRRKWQEGA